MGKIMGECTNILPLIEKDNFGLVHDSSQSVDPDDSYPNIFLLNNPRLKDRITPHVTNFSRFRLGIEKQEWKRKYKSDGGTMVVCM